MEEPEFCHEVQSLQCKLHMFHRDPLSSIFASAAFLKQKLVIAFFYFDVFRESILLFAAITMEESKYK